MVIVSVSLNSINLVKFPHETLPCFKKITSYFLKPHYKENDTKKKVKNKEMAKIATGKC